jgi:hypothetical protein
MKKLILASFIAVATAASFSIPAEAASSIVIKTDHMHRDRDHNDRMHMRRHHEHCRTRVETHWRHHHRVMEKVTVCD